MSIIVGRSPVDRRSGKERRKIFNRITFFLKGGVERRRVKERRSEDERRRGWVRVDKWSSVFLKNLMISKFLK